MAENVLVLAEQREGELKQTSFEAVTLGRELSEQMGGDLSVVIIGSNSSSMTGSFNEYGLSKLYIADGDELKYYDGERYSNILGEAISLSDASVIIMIASAMGKDIAPRIASTLDAGLAADCVSAEFGADGLIATRPIYAGKALIKVKINSEMKVLTLRPNSFPQKPEGNNEPEIVNLQLGEKKNAVREVVHVKSERPELTEASIIVSGGRGVGGPENFHLIEKLADELGAAVGASRAVVDAGWRPHSEQVGQTGKTVSPNLYIACGISGAIQHLAGMSSSKVIVAVNKDPDAPIFKVATYGIVGDLFEVIPKLVESVKELNA